MKNKLFSLFICILLICSFAVNVSAQGTVDGIIEYKLSETGAETVQEWLDSSLSKSPLENAWYILSLSDMELDFSVYRKALTDYLSENTVSSATTRQKIALALIATGGESEYIYQTLSDSVGKQGLMSYVFGLHILNNGFESELISSDEVINSVLSLQLSDGGWAVMGKIGDVDATAMVIQALAPYYEADSRVKESVDMALGFLSDSQLENGDYLGMGEPNCESVAQAIIALCSLGIDPETDLRFIKNGNTLFDGLQIYSLSSGGYCHKVGMDPSESATSQAMLSLTAYSKMLSGEGSIYLFDGVKYTCPETALPAKAYNYKQVAVCVALAIAAILCLILAIAKKLNKKNLLAILVLITALLLMIIFVDIRPAEDYYGEVTQKGDIIGSVTLEIRCDTVKGMDDHIPDDGIILETTKLDIDSSDTVYDILIEAAKKGSLHVESSGSDGLKYISGIANIYEFDFGDLSGWTYYVNGESLSLGCDEYILSDGDVIEWLYTTELGNDLK